MIHGKSWHGAHTQQWWDARAETRCSCTWSSCQPKGGRHLRTSIQDCCLTSIDAHLHPHRSAQTLLVIHRCAITSTQEHIESWWRFVFVGLVSSGGVCFVWGKIGPAGPQTCHFLASTSTETFKYGPSCPTRVPIAAFDIWCWSTSLLSVLSVCVPAYHTDFLFIKLLLYASDCSDLLITTLKSLSSVSIFFISWGTASEIIVICIYFLLAEALLVSQTLACDVWVAHSAAASTITVPC